MSLTNKIEKLIDFEERRIIALQQVIAAHRRKIRYYRDMIKVAEKVEEDEQ